MSFIRYLYEKNKEMWIGAAILIIGVLAVFGGEWVSIHYPNTSFIGAVVFLIAFIGGMCFKFISDEYKSYKKTQDGR
jgi:uncharacterized membrane-anchored protein